MSDFGKGQLKNMKKYIVSASYEGQVVGSFSFESLGTDPESACDRFLSFFLVRRSAFFDLSPDDVTPIKESKEQLDIPENTDSDFRFKVLINDKPLTVDFFPLKFVI